MGRLKQLEINGYIKVVDYIGNGENVYCITRKSCSLLNLNFTNIRKTDKINHYLASADFYFNVKKNDIKELYYEQQYYYTQNGRKYSFRPDLIFNINTDSDINKWFFVEIDLSCRRFETKVKIWEGYYKSGAFKKYFQKYPPIIIVTVDVDKIKNIIKKCGDLELNYIYKDYNEVKNWEYKY